MHEFINKIGQLSIYYSNENVLYVETLKTIKIWLKQLIILLRTQIAKNLI